MDSCERKNIIQGVQIMCLLFFEYACMDINVLEIIDVHNRVANKFKFADTQTFGYFLSSFT